MTYSPTTAGNGSQRTRGGTKDARTCASSGRAPGELSLPSAALPRSARPERAKRASQLRGEPAAGADGDGVWGHRKRAARAEHARALDGPPGGRPSARALMPADGVWGHRKRAARAEHARALDGPPGSLEEEAETGAAAPPPPAGSFPAFTTEAARASCRVPSARVTPPRGSLPSTRGEIFPSRGSRGSSTSGCRGCRATAPRCSKRPLSEPPAAARRFWLGPE